jgi:hypothetical protein
MLEFYEQKMKLLCTEEQINSQLKLVQEQLQIQPPAAQTQQEVDEEELGCVEPEAFKLSPS